MSMSQLLFSFSGRLNRKPYWLTTLVLILIVLVVIALVFGIGGAGLLTGDMSQLGVAFLILPLAYIPLLWIGLAISAKRLHDRNKSAWWLVLFYLVPGILQAVGDQIEGVGIVLTLAGLAISIWALIELGFLRGTVGPNQYGPDPLETRSYAPAAR
jgi:uncharacterized membrane protein YhaH (DUF805 family)